MPKFKNIYVVALLTLVLCAACDLMPRGISRAPVNEGLQIRDMKVSKDYRDISLSISLLEDLDSCTLDDTTMVTPMVKELSYRLLPIVEPSQPEIVSIKRVGPDEMKRLGVNLMVMVDLTLPQHVVEQQRAYLEEMRSLFSKDNMFVVFMLPHGHMSKVMLLTDYVMKNYFKPNSPLFKDIPKSAVARKQPADSESIVGGNADGSVPSEAHERAYLFRSTSELLEQMNTSTNTSFDNASKRALVILSDGLVYDEVNDVPLDPDHFLLQERLIKQSRQINSSTSIFYVPLSVAKAESDAADDAESDDVIDGGIDGSGDNEQDNGRISSYNILRMLCTSTNGRVETNFKWVQLEKHIMESLGLDYADYVVNLRNPDGKYFFGDKQILCLIFRDKAGNTIASCYREFSIANIYNPVHIGDLSLRHLALQGVMIGLIVLLLVYLIMQFVVPYVRYRLFCRKYVIDYRGTNMSFGSIVIPDTCYYCKAPFEPGDKVVVKCQHVMHKECWDENDGHCPEYSEIGSMRHAAMLSDAQRMAIGNQSATAVTQTVSSTTCQHGSHFYDRNNLFNPRNATFYLKWVLLGIVSAIMSYSFYVLFHHATAYDVMQKFVHAILDDSTPIVPEDPLTYPYLSARQLHLLVFSSNLAFFITMMMSMLTIHRGRRGHRIMNMLLRSIVASILTYLIFMLDGAIVAVGELYDGLVFMDWAAWIIATCVVVFCCVFKSRSRIKNNRFIHIIATSTVSTVLWCILGDIHNTMQMVCLVLAYIVFATGVALTIARRMPQNDHAFLNVTGPVKEMNIALYKWLRQRPDAEVTIGKSIECSLQITWDLQGDVAPVHAKIFCRNGVPYIVPMEGNMLLNKKDTIEGKSYRLYHGDTFVIGQTTMKYIEM